MRDVKGITHFVSYSTTFRAWTINGFCGDLYRTYEAAESALLDELLTILENGKRNDPGMGG
jgi:hypothetical protein